MRSLVVILKSPPADSSLKVCILSRQSRIQILDIARRIFTIQTSTRSWQGLQLTEMNSQRIMRSVLICNVFPADFRTSRFELLS